MFVKAIVLFAILNSAATGSGAMAPDGRSATNEAASNEEQENLVPESGILFEPGLSHHYQDVLFSLLLPNFTTNRECQMIVEEGSWSSVKELAVFIERDKEGRASVVRRAPKKSISSAVTAAIVDKGRPEGADYWPHLKVKASDVVEDRAALAEETAEALDQVCEMMLGTTRYPRKTSLLMHSQTVHFAHHDVNHGYRAGKTIFNKGRVGKFRRILEQLGEVAMASTAARPAAEKRVKDAAAALVAELSAAGIPIPNVKEEMRSAPSPDQP
jgi:hypothetical protein